MAIGKILNIGSGGSGGSKDGSTVVPINDVVVWQQCAKIYNDYKYNVIGDILADTACMEKLFESDSANKYLMRSPTIFNTIINNADALTFMGNIHEVRNAIATTEWMSTAVGALGYESYIKVFKHRSAISSSENVDTYDNNYSVINFKNGDKTKCSWATTSGALNGYDDNTATQSNYSSSATNTFSSPHYWYYTFSTDFICKLVRYCGFSSGAYNNTPSLQVEAYDEDSNTWTILGKGTASNVAKTIVQIDCSSNIKAYKQYRLYVSNYTYREGTSSGYIHHVSLAELQWQGVKPNVV